MFLVKSTHRQIKTDPCRIEYIALDDFWGKAEKLAWFAEQNLEEIEFGNITPDKNNNWINLSENEWDSLMEVDKLFSLVSNGVNTARDEWVFDLLNLELIDKVRYLAGIFNKQIDSKKYDDNELDYSIKWSDGLKSNLKKKEKVVIDLLRIINFSYRPFFTEFFYSEKKFSDRLTSNHFQIFGENLSQKNKVITFSGRESSKPFSLLATLNLFGFDYLEKTQCLPLYRYTSTGERIDNITD